VEQKFKIGDRVKLKKDISVFLASSKEVGTIIMDDKKNWYGVEYDNYVGGHDCNGYGKYGHCSWIKEDCLMLAVEGPILKIKAWLKNKNSESIADGVVYLIENNNFEFITKENQWTPFVTLALRFKKRIRAQLYLHSYQEEIGNPYAKVTEHIFSGPVDFVNNFLTTSED